MNKRDDLIRTTFVVLYVLINESVYFEHNYCLFLLENEQLGTRTLGRVTRTIAYAIVVNSNLQVRNE